MTPKAQAIHAQISAPGIKLGDLRKIAKEIKRDHELAMELWTTGELIPRQLAILIMDKKQFSQAFVDQLDSDIQQHEADEQNHLSDWLMANQLMKDKKTKALIETWEDAPSDMQRRIFWYYQARLRWTGQIPPDNTDYLLSAIEEKMAGEVPQVQWAMNFLTGWIGVYDAERRSQCVALGESLGLYKDEVVPRNCTPNYLPEFIRIEVAKREGK